MALTTLVGCSGDSQDSFGPRAPAAVEIQAMTSAKYAASLLAGRYPRFEVVGDAHNRVVGRMRQWLEANGPSAFGSDAWCDAAVAVAEAEGKTVSDGRFGLADLGVSLPRTFRDDLAPKVFRTPLQRVVRCRAFAPGGTDPARSRDLRELLDEYPIALEADFDEAFVLEQTASSPLSPAGVEVAVHIAATVSEWDGADTLDFAQQIAEIVSLSPQLDSLSEPVVIALASVAVASAAEAVRSVQGAEPPPGRPECSRSQRARQIVNADVGGGFLAGLAAAASGAPASLVPVYGQAALAVFVSTMAVVGAGATSATVYGSQSIACGA